MMTPEDRNNYVDYKQWANDRERKPKRAIPGAVDKRKLEHPIEDTDTRFTILKKTL